VSNAGHTLGDGNRCKAGTPTERTVSDVRHAAGDVDGGETGTNPESTPSNIGHTLGDSDGGETGTIVILSLCVVAKWCHLDQRKPSNSV